MIERDFTLWFRFRLTELSAFLVLKQTNLWHGTTAAVVCCVLNAHVLTNVIPLQWPATAFSSFDSISILDWFHIWWGHCYFYCSGISSTTAAKPLGKTVFQWSFFFFKVEDDVYTQCSFIRQHWMTYLYVFGKLFPCKKVLEYYTYLQPVCVAPISQRKMMLRKWFKEHT